MRVGVYVDGFNLYYGARGICGKGTAAWRWLDLRALASALVRAQATWPGATIERLTYCTARISKAENPSGYADQGTYIKALVATGHLERLGSSVADPGGPEANSCRHGQPE
jgi:hypothetical protein